MTAPSVSSAAVDRFSQGINSMEANPMSSGDFSDRDEQDQLQQVWIDFLTRNFRTDEEAAIFFNVDESAIRHWRKGRNGLNAKRLVKAARKFPMLRQMLFGAAA